VYDFTPVIQKVLSDPFSKCFYPDPPSKYFIEGSVQGITASGAQIVHTEVKYGTGIDFYGGNLVWRAGVGFIRPESESRLHTTETTWQINYFVQNPPAWWRLGTTVSVFAWPRGNGVFDFGTPFVGSLAGMTLNQVTETGFVPIRYLSNGEIEDRKALLLQKVIASRREDAASGDAFAQYDLAMHYLTGDGVETDRAVAINWLQSAATNGSIDAKELLEKLKQNPNMEFHQKLSTQEKEDAAQQKAAASGDPFAECDLAERYLYGNRVKKDRELAIHWFQVAATNQSERAKIMLYMLTNAPSVSTNAPPDR
jgi:hypothetical protein